MAEATLVVTRLEPDGLLLVLQSAHRDSPMRAKTHTDAKWHRKLKKSLRKFRECLIGFHQDERKLAVIGQELFRDIVPPAMRAEIRKLRVSLEVQTDETSMPWEILHDGDDFLATRLALSRKTFRTTYAAAHTGQSPGSLYW